MKSLVVVAFVVAVGACKRDQPSDLQQLVHGYCYDLESSLASAAKRHRQLAPALDENRLSSDQLKRANLDLAVTSVGNTAEVRGAKVQELALRFTYCAAFHVIDDAHETDLETRVAKIREALNEDVFTAAMPSATKTAELLDQFRDAVHEVNGFPLKQ